MEAIRELEFVEKVFDDNSLEASLKSLGTSVSALGVDAVRAVEAIAKDALNSYFEIKVSIAFYALAAFFVWGSLSAALVYTFEFYLGIKAALWLLFGVNVLASLIVKFSFFSTKKDAVEAR